jgi:hypothetical protein
VPARRSERSEQTTTTPDTQTCPHRKSQHTKEPNANQSQIVYRRRR